MKWEKAKIILFFSFKAHFVHFLWKGIFENYQRGAVVAEVNLIEVCQFVFDDMQHLLISPARGLKYFHNVELLYPLRVLNILDLQHVHMFIPWYLWPTQSMGLNLNMWTCWRLKMFEPRHMLLLLFCLNKDKFWFLLMFRTSSAEVWQKKNFAGKCKLLRPQDSYRVD